MPKVAATVAALLLALAATAVTAQVGSGGIRAYYPIDRGWCERDGTFLESGAVSSHVPPNYNFDDSQRTPEGVQGFNVSLVTATGGEHKIPAQKPMIFKQVEVGKWIDPANKNEFYEIGRSIHHVYLRRISVQERTRGSFYYIRIDLETRKVFAGVDKPCNHVGNIQSVFRPDWSFISYDESNANRRNVTELVPTGKPQWVDRSNWQAFRTAVHQDFRRGREYRKMIDGEQYLPKSDTPTRTAAQIAEERRQQAIADNEARIAARNRTTRQQAEARQQQMRDEIEANRRAQSGITIGRASPEERLFSVSGLKASVISYDGGEFRKVGDERWISHNFQQDRFTDWNEVSKSSQYLVLSRADNGMLLQFKLRDKRIWRHKSVSDKSYVFVGMIRAVE